MASIKKFEDLEIWQLARKLCKLVYGFIKKDKFSKDYGLTGQINNSSGSVMDNIAEGFGRGGNREFINFLSFAAGSCTEVKSQTYRAFDRNYITENELNECLILVDEIISKTGSLIAYLNKSEFQGEKFNYRTS
jgi:four helix bundle protein